MWLTQIIVLSSLYGLYIGHIYEILWQNHYLRTGWWFIAKVSVDPLILLLNAVYFGKKLRYTASGKLAWMGLWAEFFIHLAHFVLFKNGRPVWLSLIFNTVDIFVIANALYAISDLNTKRDNTHGVILGTMLVLLMYRFAT